MKYFSRLILVCMAVLIPFAVQAQTTTTTDPAAAATTTADPAATTTTTATTPTTTATTTTAPATTTSGTTGAVTSSSTTASGDLLTSSALVVYKLTFEVSGETINYRPYQGGYYVAPIEGGTGSLILTLTTGGVKTFYTYANFGELFVAVKGSKRKVVLSATAANTVSTTTFFAIGTADQRRHLETRSSDGDVFSAEVLRGYAVSADSEQDLPYGSSSANDIGVAGVSYLTARLDDGLTEDSINNNRTLSAAVTEIQAVLTEDGYTNGSSTTNASGAGAPTTGTATSGTAAPPSTGTTTTGTTSSTTGTTSTTTTAR